MKSKGQDRYPAARRVLANSYATLISRLVLGGVFLVAGITKALDPGGLAASIRSYELALPEWFVSLSAFGLPYLEILIGLYLIVGLFTKLSAWSTNAMMAVFILALFQGALRGLEIDCGCFGGATGAEEPSLWSAFARDLGLLALGLHIALVPTGRFSVDALLRRDSPEDGAYEV